jgi:hypothetical protein
MTELRRARAVLDLPPGSPLEAVKGRYRWC